MLDIFKLSSTYFKLSWTYFKLTWRRCSFIQAIMETWSSYWMKLLFHVIHKICPLLHFSKIKNMCTNLHCFTSWDKNENLRNHHYFDINWNIFFKCSIKFITFKIAQVFGKYQVATSQVFHTNLLWKRQQ